MYFTSANIKENVENLRSVAKRLHLHSLVLIRDGSELEAQKVSVRRKKPTQWQAAQEQYVASLPSESLYISGDIDFDVTSGDFFLFEGHRWEIIEEGIMGNMNVRRRVRAELRPS